MQPQPTEYCPGVIGVDVVSKESGLPTYFVRLLCVAGRVPEKLLLELSAIGFSESNDIARVSPFPMDGLQVQPIDLSKPGSALFNMWTEAELSENLNDLNAVFERHGLPFEPRTAGWEEFV